MAGPLYAFDVDDTLELGGQFRLPSTAGPVTIASIRQEVAQGAIAGIVGNWMGVPSVLPDWREIFSFLLPPAISNSPKSFWLAWLKVQYPDRSRYVVVGNDPHGHENRPGYWDDLYPGTLPVQHVPGDHLQSNDITAAAQAGFQFIREDDWAKGRRIGRVPPPVPQDPFYSFPKGIKLPMHYKTFAGPEVLKADDAKGIVEAIVSVTGNKDHQRDIIDPGAWSKAIGTAKTGRMPKITTDHKWSVENVIGRTLDMEEWLPGDKRLPEQILSQGFGGLWVKGQFNLDKQRARDVFSDLKGGFVNEFSVGFDIATDEKGDKCECQEDDAFHIKAIDPLYEWSPVFLGANPETVPYAVKAAQAVGTTDEALAFFDLSDEEILNNYYEFEDLPEEALNLKAKWSRAFINRLPDSAFAVILPGGQKDSSGRTAPRSLRKLPHHGPGGAVDKPHLANALSRAAQQPALKKAISHLRKHANAIGMGKGFFEDDLDPTTIDVANVTEPMLKSLGVLVGSSVVEALQAQRARRNSM